MWIPGPFRRRVYAQYAGIGWIGKNTCVINPERGSWIFLSEIICSLPLDGRCARVRSMRHVHALCLEACPTQALTAPGVLDSTRCISYLTIELKGEIPAPLRAGDRDPRLRLRHLPGSVSVERDAVRVG